MYRSQKDRELCEAADPVVNELLASELFDLAERLSACVALATTGSPNERKVALQEIGGLCHIKALGDAYVKNVTDNAWLKMLDQLSAAAEFAQNQTASDANGAQA